MATADDRVRAVDEQGLADIENPGMLTVLKEAVRGFM
jgi:hypothetical protein